MSNIDWQRDIIQIQRSLAAKIYIINKHRFYKHKAKQFLSLFYHKQE